MYCDLLQKTETCSQSVLQIVSIEIPRSQVKPQNFHLQHVTTQ